MDSIHGSSIRLTIRSRYWCNPSRSRDPGEAPSGVRRPSVTARPLRSWSSRLIFPVSFARKTTSKFRSFFGVWTSLARTPISGCVSCSIAGSAESWTRGRKRTTCPGVMPSQFRSGVMTSLTGAFYPAVDLCAGEKERGTMETLLISPATRAEIVLGKFLTVMLASVMTAVLNLVSMGLTGIVLARHEAGLAMEPTQRAAAIGLAPPTLQSAVWMVLLLIPLAAFFSAVCVALAVLARSMKEGQYYMTPLYLVCLPLIFLTLIPETKLNLFYSLVPITGVALLLRALIMGDYATGGRFFLPVMVPTVVYAWMALRWAIDQFQREEVLFREAERFNVGVWLKHLVRDRQAMPTGGQAVLCFSLILSASWFLMEYMAIQGIGANLAAVAAGQFLILFPPLIMAVMLTSSLRRTLRLNWPAPRYLALAIAFPVALNPLVNQLGHLVEQWFPISSIIKQSLSQIMSESPSLWVSVGVFALLPAICEELAFRGFILSGLEYRRRTRSAILLSALMFGFLHVLLSLFQQLFNAN